MNLKPSRGSLCKDATFFNAELTKPEPATPLTAEVGFCGVHSQIFFFFFFCRNSFVVFPECGSKALPSERRGPRARLTDDTVWLVLSFPHGASSSGPEPGLVFTHPTPSPGCCQPSAPGGLHGPRLTAPLGPPCAPPRRASSTFARVSACGWGGEPSSQARASFRKRTRQQPGRGWSPRGDVSYGASLTVHTFRLR